jgi:hypothetical protein
VPEVRYVIRLKYLTYFLMHGVVLQILHFWAAKQISQRTALTQPSAV